MPWGTDINNALMHAMDRLTQTPTYRSKVLFAHGAAQGRVGGLPFGQRPVTRIVTVVTIVAVVHRRVRGRVGRPRLSLQSTGDRRRANERSRRVKKEKKEKAGVPWINLSFIIRQLNLLNQQ